MNAEEYFALLEAKLDSYNFEETLERLNSFSKEGPTIEEYFDSCNADFSMQSQDLEVWQYNSNHEQKTETGKRYFLFFEADIQYSLIDGACNDDNYFDMQDAIFELAA